jgi:drug/metabolite transporter (DMT)-like permease
MSAQLEQQTSATEPTSVWRRLIANPWLYLALAGLLWSGNHIAGKAAAASQMPPVSMASLRWLLGAAILWPFVGRQVIADWPQLKRGWKVVVPMCIVGGGVFSATQFIALNFTSALNASIFNSFAPGMIAAAGAILFRDRLRAMNYFGIAVSFVGVLVIVSRGSFDVLTTVQFNQGDLLLLFNMAIWAGYCTCLRLRPPVHPMTFAFIVALIGGLSLVPASIWEHVYVRQFQMTWFTLAVMAYITIFSGVLSYIFWNKGQEAVGASRAAVFLHLIPFYGAVLATTLLGEHLMTFHIAGCALILAGVWIASRGGSSATPRSA